MADEQPVTLAVSCLIGLPGRLTNPPSDLNTIGAMAIPGEKTLRSHFFLCSEEIHKIIVLREVNCMSWGRISAELQVKRSKAQSAYERWHQTGLLKHTMTRHRSFAKRLRFE
jgi:hypothetical protein